MTYVDLPPIGDSSHKKLVNVKILNFDGMETGQIANIKLHKPAS